jgi:hypothetical protein
LDSDTDHENALENSTPAEIPRVDGSLAILEMKMIFAGILLKFDLDFAGERIDPLDDFWSQISPLNVRITNITKGN